MGQNHKELGIVVNYFSRERQGQVRDILVSATLNSLQFLRQIPEIGTILIVDGSNEPDPKLKQQCAKSCCKYFHAGQEVGYAQAYNIGWKMLRERYIGLMANDIVPNPPSSVSVLLDWLKKPDVGCVFPYLDSPHSRGDEVQATGYFKRSEVSCEPSSMALNLNLFKREILEEIGGVTEEFKFGFSEPLLLHNIRSLGYRCVMVGGTRAYHYAELTKILGGSNLSMELYERDRQLWFSRYSALSSQKGIGKIDMSAALFSTSRKVKLLWMLAYALPASRTARKFMRLIMWLEPWLTRYPARNGIVRASSRRTS